MSGVTKAFARLWQNGQEAAARLAAKFEKYFAEIISHDEALSFVMHIAVLYGLSVRSGLKLALWQWSRRPRPCKAFELHSSAHLDSFTKVSRAATFSEIWEKAHGSIAGGL